MTIVIIVHNAVNTQLWSHVQAPDAMLTGAPGQVGKAAAAAAARATARGDEKCTAAQEPAGRPRRLKTQVRCRVGYR